MAHRSVDPSAVLEALKSVKDPDLHRDIVTLGFIKQLEVHDGRVSFAIELTTPACPVKDKMKAEAEEAIRALPGVTGVAVTMTASVRAASAIPSGPQAIPGIRNVIAVGSGKGGVGKTTVAVNLAVALSRAGSRVGLMDGDVYGPNVPIMLGMHDPLVSTPDGQKIMPAERYGLKVVSMGFLAQDDSPVIWRGPMLHSVIRQFFQDVFWDELDYLVVDMPPGTGDVALSLSQTVPVSGAIVVTTPQKVSLADSRRAVRMYQKLNIPVLGLIENMSYFICPSCQHESDIFGRGGGEDTATDMEVPFLGRIPIYEPIRVGGDTGEPLVISEPESPAGRAFMSVAEQTAAQVSIAAFGARRVFSMTPVK